MEELVEIRKVDSDPRFLFDMSFTFDIASNQDDINSRILMAQIALKGIPSSKRDEWRRGFIERSIALSEYEWIDNSDYVTRYFIWYLMLLVIRSKSLDASKLNKFLSSGFDFDIAFGMDEQTTTKPSIPSFIETGSKIETHTIIFLHYIFREKNLQAISQQNAMDSIKRLILGFKSSHFYKLTEKENQNRAKWTREKLKNDLVVLPFKIPISERYHNLSLAISLYLWNRNSPFKASFFYDEQNISKSEYIHRLNLSWNQYKHRERNKLKKVKAYSFEMEESLQQKIDHLSRALDMKKNRLIEYLIEQEYTKQTKK
ncbi:hypothetical protein [Vibrio furnissii]|uniref:hypothetical protein n=1 Tax=Vibrio furnissii TaxID=29494 RepID=UPI0013020D8B|nr:hypothetical protein [Vibrio furnissii]